jgi:hypothetical protein
MILALAFFLWESELLELEGKNGQPASKMNETGLEVSSVPKGLRTVHRESATSLRQMGRNNPIHDSAGSNLNSINTVMKAVLTHTFENARHFLTPNTKSILISSH